MNRVIICEKIIFNGTYKIAKFTFICEKCKQMFLDYYFAKYCQHIKSKL